MRHIGIVAGILHDTGLGPGAALVLAAPFDGQRDAGLFAFRQGDGDRIGETAGQQRLVGGARAGGGAGPRGPAPAEYAGDRI